MNTTPLCPRRLFWVVAMKLTCAAKHRVVVVAAADPSTTRTATKEWIVIDRDRSSQEMKKQKVADISRLQLRQAFSIYERRGA